MTGSQEAAGGISNASIQITLVGSEAVSDDDTLGSWEIFPKEVYFFNQTANVVRCRQRERLLRGERKQVGLRKTASLNVASALLISSTERMKLSSVKANETDGCIDIVRVSH